MSVHVPASANIQQQESRAVAGVLGLEFANTFTGLAYSLLFLALPQCL